MIKNKFIIFPALLILAACGDSGTSSEDPSSNKAELQCVSGEYDFITDSDGKFHFGAFFDGNGNIQYRLANPVTGTYQVSGDSISFTGPFGPNLSTGTYNWTITSRAADCTALAIRGVTLGPVVGFGAYRSE